MQNSIRSELILSGALIIIGILLFIEAEKAPVSWFPGDIGVAAVPKLLITALIVFSIILIVENIVKLRQQTSEKEDIEQKDTPQTLKLLLATAYLFGYILILDLGFVPYYLSSFIFSFLFIQLLSQWQPKQMAISAAISLVSVVLIILVFDKLFLVVLP